MNRKHLDDDGIPEWGTKMFRGQLRIATLHLLRSGSLHGYQITKRIRERTNNMVSPGLSTIYPVLRELEDIGYVRSEWKKRRRVYNITGDGIRYLDRTVNRVTEFIDALRDFYRRH